VEEWTGGGREASARRSGLASTCASTSQPFASAAAGNQIETRPGRLAQAEKQRQPTWRGRFKICRPQLLACDWSRPEQQPNGDTRETSTLTTSITSPPHPVLTSPSRTLT
jgi:hypothetical protein